MESRPNHLLLAVCLVVGLVGVIAVSTVRNQGSPDQGSSQSSLRTTTVGSARWKGSQKIEDLEDPFQDISGEEMARIFAVEGKKGPSGKWLAAAIPNRSQRTQNHAPVFVLDTVSFLATGKITNLIVVGVTLLNAAHQPVETVGLKWAHRTQLIPSGAWPKSILCARGRSRLGTRTSRPHAIRGALFPVSKATSDSRFALSADGTSAFPALRASE
ncbi:MAG: hypothetical protein QOG23_2764 [Blastocatellia bacterium]|jgi:hypothetical protein|nr:hypothetical protein [Blastocatellia bacterium]